MAGPGGDVDAGLAQGLDPLPDRRAGLAGGLCQRVAAGRAADQVFEQGTVVHAWIMRGAGLLRRSTSRLRITITKATLVRYSPRDP